jgi:hypothetical protein
MQSLGLSGSRPRTEGKLKSLFWPSIASDTDVDYLAVWVAADCHGNGSVLRPHASGGMAQDALRFLRSGRT